MMGSITNVNAAAIKNDAFPSKLTMEYNPDSSGMKCLTRIGSR
jgi:hypothetical protein